MLSCIKTFQVSGVLLFGLMSGSAVAQEAKAFASIPTIHITGVARQSLLPDQFTLNIHTQSDGSTSEGAINALESKVQKLLENVKKAGIDNSETKSPGPTTEVIFRYYYDDKGHEIYEKREIIGYRAHYWLTITSKKMDKPGILVPAAVSADAHVEGIAFDVSNRNDILRKLDLEAITDAVTRARDMIRAADAKPGRILELDLRTSVDNLADLNKPYNANKVQDFSFAVRPGAIQLEESHDVTMEILPE